MSSALNICPRGLSRASSSLGSEGLLCQIYVIVGFHLLLKLHKKIGLEPQLQQI